MVQRLTLCPVLSLEGPIPQESAPRPPSSDVLGSTFIAYSESSKSPNSSVYGGVAASEWVATDRLNATTGQNFTSWAEFFGPHEYNSDLFTTLQRETISSSTFDYSALDIDIYRVMYPASLPQQFDPEDIIIVTNSLCSSVCADFVEMMHHEAAVRTVVAGGSPKPGPMQTASGSRGAQLYTADLIDNDISAAEYLNTSTNKLLPDRSVTLSSPSLALISAIRSVKISRISSYNSSTTPPTTVSSTQLRLGSTTHLSGPAL